MNHPQSAALFVADDDRMHWHDKALWFVRQKRDSASKSIPEWEQLREAAEGIKAHTLSRLDHYLEQFEREATAKGIHVHWAADAQAHNEIVHTILLEHAATKVVKSKSMLTEECHLNPYLEAQGIEVTDTDLGERIIQLRQEPPSHIVLPAIHLTKEQVSETFHAHLHTEQGNSDPAYLTEAARIHLREKFLEADAGITGVNFAIAETGGVVVCTNEGNADMGTSLPKLHIACMGIEKLIPSLEHLGVFTRLLARSATGQPITTYTSHFHAPVEGGALHIVIVDNGRSRFLGSEKYHKSLQCIRCGACMNTCPVYRRSGGHSYGYVIPGPIGSTLGAFRDKAAFGSLPFACTLCASCTAVCPVGVDLHAQLYRHRQDLVRAGLMERKKRFLLKSTAWLMAHPRLMDTAGRIARKLLPLLPRKLLYGKANVWGRGRELPSMPKQSFKEQYRKSRAASSHSDKKHPARGEQHE